MSFERGLVAGGLGDSSGLVDHIRVYQKVTTPITPSIMIHPHFRPSPQSQHTKKLKMRMHPESTSIQQYMDRLVCR